MGGVLTLNEAAQVSYRGDKLRRTSALSVSEGPAGGGAGRRAFPVSGCRNVCHRQCKNPHNAG